MSKDSYLKLLRDPRWQKKRLEIMSRDNFRCSDCDCADKTLNVHHLYYVAGRTPWEYEDSSLATLCEECHEIEHSMSSQADKDYIQALKKVGLRSGHIGSSAYFLNTAYAEKGHQAALAAVLNAHELLFWAGVNDEAAKEIADFVKKVQLKYRQKNA